ncbi:MAG: PAS domain S-box protein [Chitinophagaceae bacterium]|nr:PAS domain S-box protein [Chitinophagaceae bacterium]
MPLLVSIDAYKELFEHSVEAFFLADPKTTRLFHANKAACVMFGYTAEEILQLGRDAVIDTTGPHFNLMLNERLEQRKFKGLVTGVRKNGERFPVEISSVIVEDSEGGLVAATLATDLSDQQAETLKAVKDVRIIHQREEDSRALLESVLNSLGDGFFIVNRNFTVLFWNTAVEKLLHRKAEEVVGKNIWEEFPDLIMLKQYDDFEKLYNQNKSIRFRDYFPQYKMWADVNVYPSEKYISVYIKDVTEVKNLRALEKIERDVLEMNARPDSILEHTLDFYLRAIENIHPEMIVSVLRLKNNRLYNWSAPSLAAGFRDAIEGAEIGENVGSCGSAAFRKEKVVVTDVMTDPLWKDFRDLASEHGLRACWSFPLMDAYNNVMGTFAVYYKEPKFPGKDEEYTVERAKNMLTIILENKLSVEAVKMSNQSYDMVALATNDAIWDWDTGTNMVHRRGKGLKMLFGYELEESEQEENFWYKRIHPDDLDAVFEKQRKILGDPAEIYWEDEYRFLKKNGQYAYVHDKGYIIRDAAGRAIRLLGATRDITERKESEALLLELNNRLKQRADELAASNVELERFAYIASHDMQEPLRMITSFLQLFKKRYEDQIDETAEQYIHFAVDGADRMKKLIMDLLQYSRVGSNKDDFEDIHTNGLVNEVVSVFLAAAEESKAIITVDELPDVRANRTQLFQLFQNLIGNALKYQSDAPPRIHVSGKEEEKHFVFSVRDNGIGIKPLFFEKIFVLFQRLHHKSEYSGTGIGLAICKKIVERHHGKIWVESEPGKGSCFYFSIAKELEDKFS